MSEFAPVPIVVEKDGSLIPEVRTNLYLGNEFRTRPTLVLPGIGNDMHVAEHIAELTPDTVVADALPYRAVDPDSKEALRLLAQKYSLAAVKAYREAHGDERAVPNVVIESQQGIGAALGEAHDPSAFGDMVYIRPLGFNAEFLGDDDDERLRTFALRAFKTALQSDQSPFVDKWNFHMTNRIFARAGRGITRQFKDALGESIIPVLQQRIPEREADGKRTALIAGTRDKLFPAHELSSAHRAIGSKGLDLIVIDASHRSFATKRGAADLHYVIDDYLYAA